MRTILKTTVIKQVMARYPGECIRAVEVKLLGPSDRHPEEAGDAVRITSLEEFSSGSGDEDDWEYQHEVVVPLQALRDALEQKDS